MTWSVKMDMVIQKTFLVLAPSKEVNGTLQQI